MNDENRYRQDVADPGINVENLNNIFECDPDSGDMVNTTTGEIVDRDSINSRDAEKTLAEVKEMKKDLAVIEDSLPDVDGIIVTNIENANSILEKVQEQILAGNLSASMIEACSSLLNAITSAATSITGISYNNDMLTIKRDELRIREKKIMMDGIKGATPSVVEGDVNITQNAITMTREELLKELRGDG